MAKRVLWIRVCLSFHPSVLLSETFLGIGSLVCSETRMALEADLVLCVTAGIFEKKHLPPKCRRWVKNKVFEFIGKIFHCFFLTLVYKESIYYLLYSCTNPIFGKNLVFAIWAKIFSTNQIAGSLNWHISKW